MFFGQSFDYGDLAIIGTLIVLEGVLSIDNALVLGILAKRLPHEQQRKALTYGLIGAFVFRVIAILTAAYLLKWWWVKAIGGGYLLYVAVKHFFFEHDDGQPAVKVGPDGHPILDAPPAGEPGGDVVEGELKKRVPPPMEAAAVAVAAKRYPSFWGTVAVIELTDIAFAVDSILAAIAMIPSVPPSQTNPKLWVVIAGGMMGVILMRFAAVIFIKLLEKFPRLEFSAYLLVALIGAKLLVDWFFNKPPDPAPEGWHAPVNFHSLHSPATWIFWGLMVAFFAIGFLPGKKDDGPDSGAGLDSAPASAKPDLTP